MLVWGVGALNIDGCRIHANDAATTLYRGEMSVGRFPANLIHDGSDEVIAQFPDAPGQQADASTDSSPRSSGRVFGLMHRGRAGEPSADSGNEGAVGFSMKPGARRFDSGSAARFFYCAKASRADRNEGLSNPGPQFKHGTTLRKIEDTPTLAGNTHPTVKPTDLMAYLCRLVTPTYGTVLDPFMGSGSTGKAALIEGFKFIGIDMDAGYFEIAKARIDHSSRIQKQEEMFT